MKGPLITKADSSECAEPRSEFFTSCGDCGRFVPRRLWIKKNNGHGYTHALCRDCISNYDGPEYH